MVMKRIEDEWWNPSMSVTVESITCICKCTLRIILKCETEEKKNETTNHHLFVIFDSPLLMASSHWHWTLLFHHRIKLILIPNVLRHFLSFRFLCSCNHVHDYFIIAWFDWKEIYDLIDFASLTHIRMSDLHLTFFFLHWLCIQTFTIR